MQSKIKRKEYDRRYLDKRKVRKYLETKGNNNISITTRNDILDKRDVVNGIRNSHKDWTNRLKKDLYRNYNLSMIKGNEDKCFMLAILRLYRLTEKELITIQQGKRLFNIMLNNNYKYRIVKTIYSIKSIEGN